MGHFATALVPFSRLKGAPLWLLLLCAQLADFVWLALALAGVEAPRPASMLDVSMAGLHVEMAYSHTGLGTLILAAVAGLVVGVLWRRFDLAAWCAALVAGHWLCDLLSGWEHEVLWSGTPRIGLNLYTENPILAFVIEAIVAAGLVAWYIRSEAGQGRAINLRWRRALYAVFTGGSLLFLPASTTSIRQLLGL